MWALEVEKKHRSLEIEHRYHVPGIRHNACVRAWADRQQARFQIIADWSQPSPLEYRIDSEHDRLILCTVIAISSPYASQCIAANFAVLSDCSMIQDRST